MNLENIKPVRKLSQAMFVRWLALWPITVGLILYPVSNRTLRIATAVLLVLLWSGAIYFSWHKRMIRSIALGLAWLLLTFAILPGHRTDYRTLREDYATSLRSFEGCRYVWGGENRLGIDCSGLVRAGLINASVREAVQTLNPSQLRFALNLWWHDCSARALGEEHRQQTARLFEAPAINGIEPGKLQPGDLAVTDDGIHVLAFLGGSEWIEADPDVKRVLIVTVPSTNAWFETPVKIMRWQALNESAQLSGNDKR